MSADRNDPALEGEQLEAWMRAQEDAALERELAIEQRASINRDALYREGLALLQAIEPPYGTVPSASAFTVHHVKRTMTLDELLLPAPAYERKRPFRAAARALAERMTRDIFLLELWRTIAQLAAAQGVDYERPTFTHRRKSIPSQSRLAEGVEALDRECWVDECRCRLESALTRHALLVDALATIHQAWQHDGAVVLEHVRRELESW